MPRKRDGSRTSGGWVGATRPGDFFQRDLEHAVEDRYVYLRTNMPRDVIGIKKLFALYRFRWQIEFFFECLQQGNGLKSINSSNKNIIVEFILLAIISALLKLYMVIQTSRKKKVGLDSFSMIKANVKFGVFSGNYSDPHLWGSSDHAT